MIIRYNPVIGIIVLVLAASSIIAVISAVGTMNIAPFVLVLFGILYITRTAFIYDANAKSFTLKALIGPMRRIYPYDTVAVENDKIYIKYNGENRKLPVYKFFCNSRDWKNLINTINSARGN